MRREKYKHHLSNYATKNKAWLRNPFSDYATSKKLVNSVLSKKGRKAWSHTNYSPLLHNPFSNLVKRRKKACIFYPRTETHNTVTVISADMSMSSAFVPGRGTAAKPQLFAPPQNHRSIEFRDTCDSGLSVLLSFPDINTRKLSTLLQSCSDGFHGGVRWCRTTARLDWRWTCDRCEGVSRWRWFCEEDNDAAGEQIEMTRRGMGGGRRERRRWYDQ